MPNDDAELSFEIPPDDGDAIAGSVNALSAALTEHGEVLAIELFVRAVDRGLVLGFEDNARIAQLTMLAARAREAAAVFFAEAVEPD
jgi:hypothetical protein